MTKTLKHRSIALLIASILAASVNGALAQQPAPNHHHLQDTLVVSVSAPEGQPDMLGQPTAPMQGTDMMGSSQMPTMMKMMQEMHGRMIGGGMDMPPMGDDGPSSQAFNGIISNLIPHHRGAVDVAKSVLAFGKDPDFRKGAEGFVIAQEAEIAWMEERLREQRHYTYSRH